MNRTTRIRCRAFTMIELLVACAILTVLALVALLPRYLEYTRARQVGDSVSILSQDVAYLERFAQNSEPFEGATIEIDSADPLKYTCYSGRPSSLDPLSHIRTALFVRSFPDVALMSGPLGHSSPFLFAHNGSIQYPDDGQWADQHLVVTIELRSRVDRSRTGDVVVNPFTGGISTP
ncbi:MAG TPA: prepilin-type N-terminal cleavage/methylation domain-containing protein [Candidatus Eremiobacteraceae bacterium]